MEDLIVPLHRHFGHPSFRAGQEDLVRAVLDDRDLLAVTPTGSGKSLGFQLPALILPGTTLVVSPLISLMKDQVDQLNRRGIGAAALHSMMTIDERGQAVAAACRGEIRLLYVAPERLASAHFVPVLRKLKIARFVVDEAHCASEWGHNFRPDYRSLRNAASECRRNRAQPGRPAIAAFTATATPEVRDDIVGLLGLTNPRVIVAGFDRPNITLRVRPVDNGFEKHQILPQLVGERRSLVYAATRRNAELAADTLKAAGIAAAVYHAGLRNVERTRVHDGFMSGALPVVCATVAFGMGIDRPDVEAVIHVDIPGSLEAYYQQIGRAGRDGRQAIATLLWDYADVAIREFLIDHARDDRSDQPAVPLDPAEGARRREIEYEKLRRMIAYAESAACLRATILRYFGDPKAHEPCGACGNCDCRGPLDRTGWLHIRRVLSDIARASERYGWRGIAAMLPSRPENGDQPSETMKRWLAASRSRSIGRSDDQYETLRMRPIGRNDVARLLHHLRTQR
jgi:ATP-dependent DNA helicase RecQ